jgi:PAS domain S-box-containing protein
VPDALVIVDEAGHIVFVNAQTETLFGYQREELLGQAVEILVPERLRSQHVAHRTAYLASPRLRALHSGLELSGQRKNGSTFTVEINLNPLRTTGELLVIAVVRDLTARKLAERCLAAEHAVTRILAQAADIINAAPGMMQAICESLGWDVGVVWTVDGEAHVLRCVDVWHAPAVEAPALAQASRQGTFALGVGLPGRVWHSQRPDWIPDVTQEANFPRAAIAAAEGLHGAYGFPIYNGVEFLGVMEFFSREMLRPDAQLVEMMAAIGGQIGQFLERRRAEQTVRDREREFALARQIQQGLLPKTMPVVPGFAFGGAARFCQETGGDYYDFFPMADSSLGIAIGDASGHGIASAMIIENTRACLRALALTRADPGSILAVTNRCLREDLPSAHFVTLFLARLDAGARSLVYCSAGHCPGYVLDEHGKVRAVLESTSIPLGVELTAEFSSAPGITLLPGDLLFLFTDGCTETLSSEDSRFGIERALDAVRAHCHERPDEIVQALFRAMADFSGNHALLDDITAVIIKVEAGA